VVSIADSAVFRLAQATFPARGKALIIEKITRSPLCKDYTRFFV